MGRNRRGRVISGTFLCAVLGIALAANGAGAAAASDALSGPRVFGWGFNTPGAVSCDGTHVWVANFGGDSVTELNAATGALVQVITGSSYQFRSPAAISSDGTHVWVANDNVNGSVTELNAATGALVQVISGQGFDQPSAVSSDGRHVWVANIDGSVTELDAATGAVMKVISGAEIQVRPAAGHLLRRPPRVGDQLRR